MDSLLLQPETAAVGSNFPRLPLDGAGRLNLIVVLQKNKKITLVDTLLQVGTPMLPNVWMSGLNCVVGPVHV